MSSSKTLKFCANLSMMFQEVPLAQRFRAAKEAQFKAVEMAFPYEMSAQDIANIKEESGLEQVLINVFPGSNLGFAALDGQETAFMDSLVKSIEYCNALKCKKLHIMSGRQMENQGSEATLLKNMQAAVPILEQNNIVGLLEPINGYSVPQYFLNNYETAQRVIEEVNSPNLRLQLDIFHLQFIKGDLTHNIKKFLPITGHIQVAQVPDRNEPDTFGEINYKYVLDVLEQEKYAGWIGLEYNPKGDTVAGLKWIKDFGYEL